MSDEKKVTVTYPGKDIDVTWDGRLCIHIGECGRAEGELFVTGRKPWCEPDLAATEEVLDVVERCPTGALTYQSKDNRTEKAANRNTIVVSNNGPLYAKGQLSIEGATTDMPGVGFRAALCRCGQSQRKPFCDNSHEEARFVDRGAIGETGNGFETAGGPLSINKVKDGPLIVNGNLELIAASGRVAWRGTKAALCRCGASKNKPFCDGSHKPAGFEAD